jgi:hypothetical protein
MLRLLKNRNILPVDPHVVNRALYESNKRVFKKVRSPLASRAYEGVREHG